MKKLFTLLSLVASTAMLNAQTTATDFTANDCNGNAHHLFADLDAGKVVILVWVMPCSSCIGPSQTAYNIAQTYSSTYPGKIQYFLCDDYANTSCSVLNGWADNSGIGQNRTSFSNSAIDMLDYGSAGMPKIVIVAGANHQVFFNEINSAAGNATAIQSALDQAIISSGLNEPVKNDLQIMLSPNPANFEMNVSFNLNKTTDVVFQILNINGSVAKTYDVLKNQSGKISYDLKVNNLANGNYLLKSLIDGKATFTRFSIVH